MHTTPTVDMEAITGLPPLDLVNQVEARSAAYHLWSLGCWSDLHPSQGHSSILMWLQRSDTIFNMGVDVMRPAFSLEPQYRDTTLTRKEWTRGPGTPPVVKGLIWLRLVQDDGRDQSYRLSAITGKKAQYLSRETC
jgi:hypothetical protein